MNRTNSSSRHKRIRRSRQRSVNNPLFSLRSGLENISAQIQNLELSQTLRRRRRRVFAIVLLIIFVSIILIALVPGRHWFETRLVVSELSFTTNEPDSLFLNEIREVEEISVFGAYEQPLSLTGQFPDSPFTDSSELTIEFPYEYSRIIIRTTESEPVSEGDGITLTKLRLQNQTVVSKLLYTPYESFLEIEFDHLESSADLHTGILELFLGDQPLEVELEGFHLPDLPNLDLDDPDGNSPLTFTYLPDIKQFERFLPKTGTLLVQLPESSEIDSSEWIWGDLEVKDVSFLSYRKPGGAIDEEIVFSTIRSGTVRMVDQDLTIEPDQFLIIKNPGIQRIRHLQILDGEGIDGEDSDEEGIEVRAVGKSSQIQVGLDSRFPIKGIRSNILAQIFPPDVVIAIISFSSAMVASILLWLVENLFKNPQKDDEDEES